jgi:hypothetical protein
MAPVSKDEAEIVIASPSRRGPHGPLLRMRLMPYAASASFLPFSTASSMVPTM